MGAAILELGMFWSSLTTSFTSSVILSDYLIYLLRSASQHQKSAWNVTDVVMKGSSLSGCKRLRQRLPQFGNALSYAEAGAGIQSD